MRPLSANIDELLFVDPATIRGTFIIALDRYYTYHTVRSVVEHDPCAQQDNGSAGTVGTTRCAFGESVSRNVARRRSFRMHKATLSTSMAIVLTGSRLANAYVDAGQGFVSTYTDGSWHALAQRCSTESEDEEFYYLLGTGIWAAVDSYPEYPNVSFPAGPDNGHFLSQGPGCATKWTGSMQLPMYPALYCIQARTAFWYQGVGSISLETAISTVHADPCVWYFGS
jgi:hypothetical protein